MKRSAQAVTPGHTNIRVSREFADQVKAAAETNQRSAAGQLIHWARLGQAVEAAPHSQVQALLGTRDDGSGITDELARRRRRDGLTAARVSMRLEGFVVSAEAEAIGERYVAGKLTIEEMVAEIEALHAHG